MHHYLNFLFVHGLKLSIEEKSRCLRDNPFEVVGTLECPDDVVAQDIPPKQHSSRKECNRGLFSWTQVFWEDTMHTDAKLLPMQLICYINVDYVAFFCFWQLELLLFRLFTCVIKSFQLNVVILMVKLFTYRQMQTMYEFGCMKNKEFN